MLGHEHTRPGGLLDRRRARREVRDDLAALQPRGAARRPRRRPAGRRAAAGGDHQGAQPQRPQLLILDEPTAVLTPQETDELIAVMRALRDAGTSIVFISHKLREVRAVADTITVIRRGKVVGQAEPTASANELASLMVGRPVAAARRQATPRRRTTSCSSVAGVTVVDDNGIVLVDDVSLSVRGGEIYALAGVQGNGQTELTEALVGLTPLESGRVDIDGADIAALSTDDILGLGVGYVPGGPPARRAGRRLLGRREPRARPVRPAAVRLARRAQAGRDRPQRHRARRGVRRPHQLDVHACRHAVRRQPAEGRARARAVAAVAAARRGPADPRAGRRLDGVRAPAHRGRT